MDELRGEQAAWRFDGERIEIRYETKGWFKSPLLKQLARVEVPVGAIRSVDFQPKAGRKKGWIFQLRLRERMDPYAVVGAMLDEKSQPFRLTGSAKTELIAEYLADQIRFAAEHYTGDPTPDLATRLVPDLPLHIQTSEGTASFDDDRLRLVWSGVWASGYKKKKQRREYDLADITGVEWVPPDGWEWGYLRVVTSKSAKEAAAKPKHDLNVLLASEDSPEPEMTLVMAATVTAHLWARGAATRPALGSGEVTDADIDDRPGLADPEWWRDAAQNAVGALGGPRITLNMPGSHTSGQDADPEIGSGTEHAPLEAGAASAVKEPGQDTEWIFAQIERLGELKEKGLLTEEEFTTKKAELLGRI